MLNSNDGDAKRFLAEDVLLYGGGLILSLGHDYFIAGLHLVGIDILFNGEVFHPQGFGHFQITGIIFCGTQLLRKIVDWRYYGD